MYEAYMHSPVHYEAIQKNLLHSKSTFGNDFFSGHGGVLIICRVTLLFLNTYLLPATRWKACSFKAGNQSNDSDSTFTGEPFPSVIFTEK